jgi:hypothetical protein
MALDTGRMILGKKPDAISRRPPVDRKAKTPKKPKTAKAKPGKTA